MIVQKPFGDQQNPRQINLSWALSKFRFGVWHIIVPHNILLQPHIYLPWLLSCTNSEQSCQGSKQYTARSSSDGRAGQQRRVKGGRWPVMFPGSREWSRCGVSVSINVCLSETGCLKIQFWQNPHLSYLPKSGHSLDAPESPSAPAHWESSELLLSRLPQEFHVE